MANYPDRESVFQRAIAEHLRVIDTVECQQELLETIAVQMAAALHRGNKVLWCGNGGSAADSQHLAAEIVGRYRRERRGHPSIALTTDTSILTAVANDYGYDAVFSRQVEALGNPGDILVGISTSGNSSNVIAAIERAKLSNLTTVAFTGLGGGRIAQIADHVFAVDSRDTARVQEAHILAGHMICDWLELDLIASQTSKSTEVEASGTRIGHAGSPSEAALD
jgi:D-sedoheptulose 7-phosphate isomerase